MPPPEIPGEYYFSDGSFGKFDEKKTVIGIVFSHNLSSLDSRHWSNGYALALTNASNRCQWGNNDEGSDNPMGKTVATHNGVMTFMDGRNCTAYITNTGDDRRYPAAFAAEGYNSKVAAPSSSSGWFLPSCGQWYDFLSRFGGLRKEYKKDCTDFNEVSFYTDLWWRESGCVDLCLSNINAYLNVLKEHGYTVDLFDASGARYWTSSLNDANAAYCVGITASQIYFYGTGNNNTDYYRVRPMIAF